MTAPGVARILAMFSVATLAIASPVYTRLWESPGAGGLLRLVLLVQVLPTIGLTLIDAWLLRGSRRAWSVWRGVLAAVCLFAVIRQAQLSLRVSALSWASTVLVSCAVAALGLLVLRSTPAVHRFLAAFAPGLVAWTLFTGYTLLPAFARVPRDAAPTNPPAVFVLLFDELDRDMVLTRDGVPASLPGFRRLVERSRVFADATANYDSTCASVASLLRGRLLDRVPGPGRGCLGQVDGLREDNLLVTAARQYTVRVHAQYLGYCLDAAFVCRGTAQLQARAPYLPLLQHYVPDGLRAVTGTERLLGVSQHTYARPLFDEFLADVGAPDSRRAFHWLHVLLPHGPYVFDGEGRVHPQEFDDFFADDAEYPQALAAYRRQVGFVDRLLGRFLDRLEAAGLADDSIVIVTSDHGFHSRRAFAPPQTIDGFEVNAARPRATLIVRAPGLAPGITRDDYQHVDFARLVRGLIAGTGIPTPVAPARDKVFCSAGTWYARDDSGRWRPQQAPDGRPRRCDRVATSTRERADA
jgi:hypothetical protein